MLAAVICIDRKGALDLRLATREAHLAYVRETGVVRLAGPFLAEDGGAMAGSLIILEVADLAAARAWAAGDPYGRAGLFERVEVRPFRAAIGSIGP